MHIWEPGDLRRESCFRDPGAHKLGTLKGEKESPLFGGWESSGPRTQAGGHNRADLSQVCAEAQSQGQSQDQAGRDCRAWQSKPGGAGWGRVEPGRAERSRVEPNLAEPATLSRADSKASVQARSGRVGLRRVTAAPSRPRPAGLTHHFPASSQVPASMAETPSDLTEEESGKRSQGALPLERPRLHEGVSDWTAGADTPTCLNDSQSCPAGVCPLVISLRFNENKFSDQILLFGVRLGSL